MGKVIKGYEFYARSGRNDLDLPPVHLTIACFRSRAAEQLVFAEAEEVEPEPRDKFAVDRPAVWWNRRKGPVEPRPPALCCGPLARRRRNDFEFLRRGGPVR
jgi:hypothetical protein